MSHPILQTYQIAQEKGALIFLNKAGNRARIRSCLKYFIASKEYDRANDITILDYLNVSNHNDVSKAVYDSDKDDYKSISEFLKRGTNPNNDSTIPLAQILLEFDISCGKNLRQIRKSLLEGIINIENVTDRLVFTYRNHPKFNSIRIMGDDSDQLRILSMDKYYVQLSYLSHPNLQRRDTLVSLEKQSTIDKVKKTRVSDYSGGYITQNVLSNDKVIITGNPGVGKSTFAKSLCYSWGRDFSEGGGDTLIYIELRSIDFTKEYFIESYIKEVYLSEVEISIENLVGLFENSKQFKFVLDGLDELSTEYKNKLIAYVSSRKYIFLTRPYGLIDVGVIVYDFSLQIDGFNSSCIQRYIDNFLPDQNPINGSKEELLSLLESNRVLWDYAHTPLMLSYIVLIYLRSPSAKKELGAIDSIYELQESVYDWILHYSNSKGHQNVDFSKKMRQRMEKFSYELLLSKKFTYKASLDDPYFNVAQNLSALGLGSQKKERYKWQFSFNTITFQEFLAAKYLERKGITTDGLIYLITDHFFWNYCLFIVGMFSGKNHHLSKLQDTLDYLKKLYLKDKHDYYGYAYYLLLGECNSKLIEAIVTKKTLIELIAFYENSYFDDFWSAAYHSACSKIIYKSSSDIKEGFVNIVKRSVEKSSISKLKNETSNIDEEGFFYLSGLIQIACDYNEPLLLKTLLIVTAKLFEEKEKIKKERQMLPELSDNEDELLENQREVLRSKLLFVLNSIRFFVSDLELFSKTATQIIPIKLKKSFSKISIENIQTLEHLIGHLGISLIENDQLQSRFRNFQKQYGKDIASIKEQGIIIDEFFYITVSLYQQLVFNKQLSPQELYLLKFMTKWLMEYTNDFDLENIDETRLDLSIDIVITLLTTANHSSQIDLLFEVLVRFDTFTYSEIPDNESFLEYFGFQINKTKTNPNAQQLEKLVYIISRPINIKKYFILFKDKLVELFDIAHNHLGEKKLKAEEEKNVKWLLITIAAIAIKDFDKKYFIDYLMTNQNTNIDSKFIYNEILLKILFSDFVFYEDKYWKLVDHIREEYPNEVISFLQILNNRNLYFFTSNHPHITKLFLSLLEPKKYPKNFLQHHGLEILSLISHLLFYVKNMEDKNKIDRIFATCSYLLQQEVLKEIYHDVIQDLSIVECSLAYVFYYFYHPSKNNFMMTVDLYNKLHVEPSALVEFYSILIQFAANENYGIEIQKIDKMKPVLGKKLYNGLTKLINQRLINKNLFDPEYFKMLLKPRHL